MASPNEIASASLACSDAASFLIVHAMVVDGARTVWGSESFRFPCETSIFARLVTLARDQERSHGP
jgi:hypothetical protein